jgi:hypothetical protein
MSFSGPGSLVLIAAWASMAAFPTLRNHLGKLSLLQKVPSSNQQMAL